VVRPEALKPERWPEVERLYHAALELEPPERAAFLTEACSSDAVLRQEVESLLSFAAPAEKFIETPALEVAAQCQPEVQTRLMVGQQLGSYLLLSLLGAGGMGEVYRARDPRLDREVAIKVLPERLAHDPEALARFRREAKTVAALSHPNILAIHDFGTERDVCFAVMELLEGETLRSRLRRAPLAWREAVEIAAATADGLSAAHAKGIIHRDLKPENVFLTRDGQVKVLDFGIARVRPVSSSSASTVTNTREPGTLMGTAGYMSPEQVRCERLQAASDVFSLGCVLYEMLTGRRAFDGSTVQETMTAVLRDDPPALADTGTKVPLGLEQVIRRCLEKQPEKRYQSARDLAFDLGTLLSETELELRQVAQERTAANARRRSWLVAAVVLGAVLIGIGAVWTLRGRYRTPESPSPSVPFTSYPGHEVQPSFSPDGNQVVFVWNGERQDNPDLYVKLIGGAEKPLRLTSDPAPDLSPAWSPDGRYIAFVRDEAGIAGKSSVLLVPAIGGPERLVTELGAPLKAPAGLTKGHNRIAPFPLLTWVPGGKHLIITDHGSHSEPLGLFVVSLETGEKRRLTSAPAGTIGDAAPAVSPDGRTLIFSRASGLTVSELYRLPLTDALAAAGEPERLTSTQAWNTSPAWLPHGREFIFASGSWHVGPFSLWRMPASTRGAPQRLAAVAENSAWPAISRDKGRLVFSRITSDLNIWRVPLKSGILAGTPERLIASTRDETVPQYSPDGTRIVFTSNRSGVHEVWTSNSDGSDAVQLTFFGAATTGSPHWSPDGKRIVFDSNVEGQFEIYVVDAAGGHPRRLTYDRADDALATFSPDGRFIYFASTRTGSVQVWRMLADGQEPVQITRALGRAPMISRDGKRIWYDKPNAGLWNSPLEGGQEKQILKSVGFLNATVTETGIYFIPRCGGIRCSSIEFFSFATGIVKPVITIGNRLSEGLTISPDGKFLLYTQQDQSGSDLRLVEGFR
jgi:Tol biopolymer transport system component/Ser/Thr protein kinase RdoA (MazF antagonist)